VFAAASRSSQPLCTRRDSRQADGIRHQHLVLVVPRSNPAHIASVDDITRPGVKLVICNSTVPCGDYARTAFMNLGITAAAMKNVVSQTTDVTKRLPEVALGQADADSCT